MENDWRADEREWFDGFQRDCGFAYSLRCDGPVCAHSLRLPAADNEMSLWSFYAANPSLSAHSWLYDTLGIDAEKTPCLATLRDLHSNGAGHEVLNRTMEESGWLFRCIVRLHDRSTISMLELEAQVDRGRTMCIDALDPEPAGLHQGLMGHTALVVAAATELPAGHVLTKTHLTYCDLEVELWGTEALFTVGGAMNGRTTAQPLPRGQVLSLDILVEPEGARSPEAHPRVDRVRPSRLRRDMGHNLWHSRAGV